jgi:KDO2-lipid IV(A) lauroyltransferase
MASAGKATVFNRFLRWPVEGALAFLLLGAVRLIPADAASAIGGALGRTLGPLLPVSKVGRINLKLAFPEKSEAERAQILKRMWDHLGRTIFEYPHLGRLSHPDSNRVEVINPKPLADAYFAERPGVYFGAHLGNFEVMPLYAARRGLLLHAFARAPNNPLFAKVVEQIRGTGGARLLSKQAGGMLGAINVLRQKGYLAVLIDQKQNRGAPIPFFGREAMTAMVPAQLALRFNAVVVLGRTERVKGARFRITISDPWELPDSGDRDADALELTRRVTAEVERWVREKPEDWLWLHRRWPDALYYTPEQLAKRKKRRRAQRERARASGG